MARIVAFADLFFGAKIKETLVAAGHDVVVISGLEEPRRPGEAPPADLVIIDLDRDRGGVALEVPGAARTLAYYSHVDVEKRRAGEEAGFDLVVPRSRMARELPELVERLIASAT